MAVFNIFGMCILRDTFSFVPSSEHKVQHFLQWTHPANVFVFNQKPERTMELKHFGHDRPTMNFKERCIVNDYNRTVLDYFVLPSDYFLLDLTTMVHTHLLKETQSDGSIHYITNSKVFMENIDNGLRENLFKDKQLVKVPALDILAEVGYERIIDAYVDWLLEEKGYRPDQIIVVENRSVHHYSDGDALFELHLDFRKENELLRKCYDYFEERCPGCHVIKMPCNVYADLYHQWGVTDLHFCIEYYEYLYACIDAVTKGGDSARVIDRLYEDYSLQMMKSIYRLINGSFRYVSGKNLLRGSLGQIEGGYIAPKGTPYYAGINRHQKEGELAATINVRPCGENNAKFVSNDVVRYLDRAQCLKGCTGSEQAFGNGWYTMNSTTQVQFTGSSVIVSHNGTNNKYQSQILQIVENNQNLCGKPVVLSVYARVLKKNSQGKGGAIALINDNGYNKGIFLAHKTFVNTDWERISLSFRLPQKNSFRGLTVCLRSITASDSCNGAVVEFRDPKLEIGAFPTAVTE